MRYGSVCSGIEAATVAWHSLGWEPVFFSEIEPFPCAVLKHHYPAVPNHGDMTKFKEWPNESIDVLVGGTPCQSFSVAGLRAGLADPRGNLMLTYLAIADRYRPEWLVWENVPGVLSSNGGRDFGTFLQGVGELGYGFAYRILDAQYFGVAQRRRRVFVVANARSWQRAAAVLFERESLCGNPAPSREARQTTSRSAPASVAPSCWPADVASTLNAAFGSKQGLEDQHALGGGSSLSPPEVAMCLNAGAMGRQDAESETLIAVKEGAGKPITFGAQMSVPQTDVDLVQTLQATNPMAVAFAQNQLGEVRTSTIAGTINTNSNASGRNTPMVAQPVAMRESGQGYWMQDTVSGTLRAEGENRPSRPSNVIAQPSMQVRRLTPVECERLQGFPDGYTNIPWRKAPESPDGPRYKALGNSMAVPVMRWIGQRIQKVSEL